jgi:hypothetical protein
MATGLEESATQEQPVLVVGWSTNYPQFSRPRPDLSKDFLSLLVSVA